MGRSGNVKPSLKQIFSLAAAPTIIGWVTSWVSPFVETPLSFHTWSNSVEVVIAPLCSVLVLVIVGTSVVKPLACVKRWAALSAVGFAASVVSRINHGLSG
jgi:hypothetical protein